MNESLIMKGNINFSGGDVQKIVVKAQNVRNRKNIIIDPL
jgi:hypothetical protein